MLELYWSSHLTVPDSFKGYNLRQYFNILNRIQSVVNITMCVFRRFQRRSSTGNRTSAMLSNWTWSTWTNVPGPVAAVQGACLITNACPATPRLATAAHTPPALRRTASGPRVRPRTGPYEPAAHRQPATEAHTPPASRAAARSAY